MGLYETRVVEGMPEKISSPRWPTKRIANAVLFFFVSRACPYGYLLRSIRLHRLRRQQTTKSMGLYETRVVKGLPEKISSPRWPTEENRNSGSLFY